jgi:hypothetical protein
MVPSGNANTAATLSRNGVSGLISSRGGTVQRIVLPKTPGTILFSSLVSNAIHYFPSSPSSSATSLDLMR